MLDNSNERPCSPVPAPYDPSSRPLFEYMMARYLGSTSVRHFLFDRSQKKINTSTFLQSFSYACMYYPASSNPKNPQNPPKPFLDLGDFLVYHQISDGFALGTIYNKNEVHSLSTIRDSVMKKPFLSNRPRVRNFAIDLRIHGIELVEFSWMDDDSLILACRRLYYSPLAPHKPHIFSADLLFFPVLSSAHSIVDPPLLRALLNETPALCQFCGSVGIGVCRCHPSCKVRAPAHTLNDLSAAINNMVSGNESNSIFNEVDNDSEFYINDPKSMLPDVSHTWSNYSRRIVDLNQSGAFFCKWYKRSTCGKALVPAITPRHPVPYQFITGKRKDTLRLITLYLQRFHIAAGAATADLRLKATVPSDNKNFITDDTHGDADSIKRNADGAVCTSMVSILPSSAVLGDQQHSSIVTTSQQCTNHETSTLGEQQSNVREESNESSREVHEKDEQVVKYRGVSVANKKEQLKQFMSTYVKGVHCLPCKRTFSKRSNLVRHIETKHFELKPFECDKCKKRFGHSNHLRRHVAKLHATTVKKPRQLVTI